MCRGACISWLMRMQAPHERGPPPIGIPAAPGFATLAMAAHARQPIGFAAAGRLTPIIPLAAHGGAQLLAPPLPPVREPPGTGTTSPPLT